jgi:LAO/AO transport system kinase
MTTQHMIHELRKGNKRVIAQAISAVENDRAAVLLKKIFPYTGSAYYIGITGPPGAGKSTLVNALAKELLGKNFRIGIIAVDPTSPFSGGALLGDRVRMTELALHKNVFIRSMASRGSLGGLAYKTKDALLILDASGVDYVIIETIGVGQVELDIAQVCDTTVVVLVPESGDSIQALKAGLLEIADVMVVNKGDREGCERLMTELKFASELREQHTGWPYPIIKTIAIKHQGIDELVSALEKHQRYLETSGELEHTRKDKLLLRIIELIEGNIRMHMQDKFIKKNKLENLVNRVYRRRLDPYSIADKITRQIIGTER